MDLSPSAAEAVGPHGPAESAPTAGGTRPTAGPFRIRRRPRLLRLMSARVLSIIGNACTLVAIAFAILDAGGSAGTVAVIIAGRQVVLAMAMMYGGVIADHTARHRVMVGADLLAGSSQAVLASLILIGRPNLALIGVLTLISGIGAGLFIPANSAALPQIVELDNLKQANSLLRIAQAGATVAGSALGGLVVTLAGTGYAIAIDSGTFFLSALLLSGLRLPPIGSGERRPPAITALRIGWAETESRDWLWRGILLWAVNAIAFTPFLQLLGPLAARQQHGPGQWSALFVAISVGLTVGGTLAYRTDFGRAMTVALPGLSLVAAPSIALALQAPIWADAAAGVLAGSCLAYADIIWMSNIQRRYPDQVLSRVSAFNQLCDFTLGPLSLLAFGPIADEFGVRAALLACAGILVLAPLVAVRSGPLRHLGSEPAEPGAMLASRPDWHSVEGG